MNKESTTFNRRAEFDTSRSYKTIATLDKALENFKLNDARHFVFQLKDGRFTAVFIYGWDRDNTAALRANQIGFPGA